MKNVWNFEEDTSYLFVLQSIMALSCSLRLANIWTGDVIRFVWRNRCCFSAGGVFWWQRQRQRHSLGPGRRSVFQGGTGRQALRGKAAEEAEEDGEGQESRVGGAWWGRPGELWPGWGSPGDIGSPACQRGRYRECGVVRTGRMSGGSKPALGDGHSLLTLGRR